MKNKVLLFAKNVIKKLRFDKDFYLKLYPDVKNSQIDPYYHYIKYGMYEKRAPNRKEYNKHLMDLDAKKGQVYIYLDDIKQCKNADGDIAVHLHLYYEDLTDEMISYLSNIPFKFDLFISVSCEDIVDTTKRRFSGGLPNLNSCFVECVENIGRDIYPFVCYFADRLLKYKYFCHIQTKKSLSSTSFTKLFFWRKYLLDGILGSEQTVRRIFSVLKSNETGMVFPEPFYNIAITNLKIDWWKRFPEIHYILNKLKINLPKHDVLFPVGTMFWCKIESIKPILTSSINKDDFPKEQGILNDGSVAHALERLLGIVPVEKGYKNYIIRSPLNKYFKSYKLADAQKDLMLKTFSKAWYNKCYPDVAFAKMDPLEHYQRFGFFEGRIHLDHYSDELLNDLISKYHLKKQKVPSDFDSFYYMKEYKEAADALMFAGVSPYEHYLNIGSKVGFTINDTKRREIIDKKVIDSYSFAIIIPVYNSAEYLENCLESAYHQTVKNLHVIIVNDGSKDNSGEIIERYRAKYPDITTVITHKVNKGLSITHRAAIRTVEEDYFTILDGDDWLELNFCEELFYICKAYELECVCCNWTRPMVYSAPGKTSQLPIDLRVLEGKSIVSSIAKWKSYPNIHYGLNRKLYLTSAWKSINPEYPKDKKIISWEDLLLTTNFFCKCKRIGCIRNFYYHWFKNINSVGSKDLNKKYINDNFSILNEIIDLKNSPDHDLNDLYARNVDNTIHTEFCERLQSLMKKSKKRTREILEHFATVYDANLHLFDEKQKDLIETFVMEKYYQSFLKVAQIKDYVLLLDPVGITNISLYFRDYFVKNTDYEVVYVQLTKKDSLTSRIQNMIVGCEAKVIITTGGWAMKQFHSNRPKIQLWHGLGALKNVAPFPKALSPVLGFCSSPDLIDVYSKLFNVSSDRVKPYGSIVTDNLFSDKFKKEAKEKLYRAYPNLVNKKVYLWCPTFRGSAPNLYMSDLLDLRKISQCLKEDEIFLVKLHPAANNLNIPEFDVSDLDNVINVTNDGDLFELLAVIDVFITDYSSSLHYAMLMNIPVAFLITDYAQYSMNPGILIKYEEFPGPICQNLAPEQLLITIRDAGNFDKQRYKAFVNKHCGACFDGNSRSRILSEIKKVVDAI